MKKPIIIKLIDQIKILYTIKRIIIILIFFEFLNSKYILKLVAPSEYKITNHRDRKLVVPRRC